MECLERTAALWDLSRVVRASQTALSRNQRIISPQSFTEPTAQIDSDVEILWVEATSLFDGSSVFVPADLVFSGRPPSEAKPHAFRNVTSNGLGAGFTLDDAIHHALREIIERDVVSCYELRASHFGVSFLAAIAKAFGLDDSKIGTEYCDQVSLAKTISIGSLPERGKALCSAFERAGVEVVIKALPNDFGIPAFGAASIECVADQNVLATAGYSVNFNSTAALCGAIAEVCQGRATHLQGAREDYSIAPGKLRWKSAQKNSHWMTSQAGVPVDFSQIHWGFSTATNEVQDYLHRLNQVGLSKAVFVRFRQYRGIEVVRVLVPEVETWHATGGMSRLGKRLKVMFGES